MTAPEERRQLIAHCDEAAKAGARWKAIGEVARVHPRTIRRWRACEQDRRSMTTRSRPDNALSEQEQQAVLEICCNRPEYSNLSPA